MEVIPGHTSRKVGTKAGKERHVTTTGAWEMRDPAWNVNLNVFTPKSLGSQNVQGPIMPIVVGGLLLWDWEVLMLRTFSPALGGGIAVSCHE